MTDHRMGADLFADVLGVLDRHGFARGDIEHQGRAISLIKDLARTYEGTQDRTFGPSLHQAPDPQPAPEPSAPGRPDTAIPASDLTTVLTALDTAADDLRDQAETCTHCPDQFCTACQSRLHAAQAYDLIACRILRPAPTAPAAHLHRQADPPGPVRQPGPAVGKEAGQ